MARVSPLSNADIPKLGILISGRGSHFKNILDATLDCLLPAKIALVCSNNIDAPGLKYAEHAHVPIYAQTPSKIGGLSVFEEGMIHALQEKHVDLIVLAGYMRILSPSFIQTFPKKIINIHPSLLPAFKGINAQEQAFDYGVKITGCTTHYVTEDLDSGEIIAQKAVPILDTDTLASLNKRLLLEEHQLLLETLLKWCLLFRKER